MGFQPVPDTAEVTIVWGQNVEILTNVFHAELGGGYNQSDIEDLAAAVDAAVPIWFLPVMSNDASYVRTEVRGLANENDFEATNEDSTALGDVVNKGNPNSVTLSIKKQSPFTGRSARGRWYFVGTPDNILSTNENVFIAAAVDDLVAAVTGLRLAILLEGWQPVIVSRFSGGVARTEGETFDWISEVSVNNFVDTQRRRLTT